jgi:hypothetical protein
MDITKVLKFADELIFAKTGEHIDYLQEAILQGTLQDQTYAKIAEATHSSEGHVRDVGSGLWKILSEGLGEDITKRNFRVILEKSNFYNSLSAIGRDYVTVNNVNICPQTAKPPQVTQQPQQTPTQPHIDLGEAPEIFNFYDRTPQLTTLETWILQDQSRLIALLGISGIGKTTLTLRLIEQIKTNFDYVIYRSLRFSPTLNATLTNLLQIFSDKTDIPQNIETQISQLLDYLRKYRCLIILDDVQMLFSSGQLAGQYKTAYEDYQLFFKLIAEVCHHSCSILISWEKSREIAKLERVNNYVHSLVLGSLGIAAKEILKQQNLSDEEAWETLINTYQGNPLWLELTTTLIQDLFSSSIFEFLQCDGVILSESLQAQLDQQFQRLTPPEIVIMMQLAQENDPVSLPQIIKTVQLSTSDLLNAMQSLGMRLFMNAEEQGKTTFFSLNPVMKQYVKNRLIK